LTNSTYFSVRGQHRGSIVWFFFLDSLKLLVLLYLHGHGKFRSTNHLFGTIFCVLVQLFIFLYQPKHWAKNLHRWLFSWWECSCVLSHSFLYIVLLFNSPLCYAQSSCFWMPIAYRFVLGISHLHHLDNWWTYIILANTEKNRSFFFWNIEVVFTE
jgi:hypothetical protein